MATGSLETSSLRPRRLEGKVALITGGASGIGAATARHFARHGAQLVLADIDDSDGQALASTLGATYVHCDVSDEAQVTAAVDAAVSTYGHLDIVFANAGTADAPYTSLASLNRANFDRVMSVNVTGVALTLKHAARIMVPAKRARQHGGDCERGVQSRRHHDARVRVLQACRVGPRLQRGCGARAVRCQGERRVSVCPRVEAVLRLL